MIDFLKTINDKVRGKLALAIVAIVAVCFICIVCTAIVGQDNNKQVSNTKNEPILMPTVEINIFDNTATPDIEATVRIAIAATQSAQPTNTPTRKPTNTPTRKPTNTPTRKPTNTPTRKPTNTPTVSINEVDRYALEVSGYTGDFSTALGNLGELLQSPKLFDDNWRLAVVLQVVVVQLFYTNLENMNVPNKVIVVHEQLLDASSDCNMAVEALLTGLDNLDVVSLNSVKLSMNSCNNKLTNLTSTIEKAGSLEKAAVILRNPTPIPTSLPKTDDYGVQKQVGTWGMKLYDVKRAKTVYFFGTPETAQGVWFIPFVEFINLSTGTRAPWEDLDFYLFDEQGHSYDAGFNDAASGAAWQFQAGNIFDDVQPGLVLGMVLPVDTSEDIGNVWLRVEQDPSFAIYLGNASSIPLE